MADLMADIRAALGRIEDKIDRTGGTMKPKPQPQRCSHPNCKTWTLDRYCSKHRPRGEWGIASQVREEQKGQQQR